MSQNRFLQLEETLKERRSSLTGKGGVVISKSKSTNEVTETELREIIKSAGVIDSPESLIKLLVKMHEQLPNALIKGQTIRNVLTSGLPSEITSLLQSIDKIEKKGSNLTLNLTQSSVKVDAGGQTITLSSPVTATLYTINTTEVVIKVKGASVWAGNINKVFITKEKVSVKVGILPAITIWEVKSGTQAVALNYIPELYTVLSLSLGEQIVKNYNDSNDKQPGGDCFAVAKSRVMAAYTQVHGKDLYSALPASPVAGMSSTKFFDMLWNIWYWHNNWLKAPQQYRAKGSAGAVTWAGIATSVDHASVISGGLKPGAVVQVWKTADQFNHLRDNHNSLPPGAFGHSFIFLKYHYVDGNIEGMYIADQGTGWDGSSPMKISTWGHYSGANFN